MADVTVPVTPALVTLPNVELAMIGQWNLGSGTATFTRADLAEAVAALDCPAIRNPPLKLGHAEPDPDGGMRWDGEPSIGWIGNMALADDGGTLVGDYVGVPAWIAEILPSAWPDRSIEARRNFLCQAGHVHPFVISAVALLGVVEPGIGMIQSLQDVAALYRATDEAYAASADQGEAIMITFHTDRETTPMPTKITAAVSSEDIRRAYYESSGNWSRYICEMIMDPLQLILMDEGDGKYYRVPVTIKGDSITFAEPIPVAIEYVDQKTAASSNGHVVLAASAERRFREEIERESARTDTTVAKALAVHHTATDTGTWDGPAMKKACAEDETDLRKAFAWVDPEGDPNTKTAYKFIHHDVAPDGSVGAANMTACSAGIGVLNGGRGGTTIPDEDRQGVYDHLAAHLRDGDMEPPELASAPAASQEPAPTEPVTPRVAASRIHGAPIKKGASNVEFSDAQLSELRKSLGIAEEEELTPDALVAAAAKLSDAKVLASKGGPGTIVLDAQEYAKMQAAINRGEEFRRAQMARERDEMLDGAIKAGKFAPARRGDWVRMWEADPDGTRQVIASLTPGMVPVEDIGYPGDPDAYGASEFDRLFPPVSGASS